MHMQSKATTVAEYLTELPPDRRAAISAVRDLILGAVDGDIEEGMTYGMIGYYVPHRVFPEGYHCNPSQPMPYINLGVQKNYLVLHLMCVYMNPLRLKTLQDGFAKAGKKLDMGKACVRFKNVEDLALEAIRDVIERTSTKAYLAEIAAATTAKKAVKTTAKSGATRKATVEKTPATKAVATRTTARK